MAITPLKQTQIVNAGLGVLVRDVTLPQLVWRDAAGDFAGALNDTISIRVPSFATARTRTLRSGSARTRDSLTERKIDVSLTTDVYKDLRITDEELSLDISDFGVQVLNPVMGAIARKLEDTLASTITAATYAKTIPYTYATGEPYVDIAIAARRYLNDAQVPMDGRVLLVGSGVEAELLSSDKFISGDFLGGAGTAMRDASIGRVAGFNVVTSPALNPDEAYAFHKTAYVMSQRAPKVPDGAAWGKSQSFAGMALRMVQVLDPDTIEDILAADAWVGSNVVTDEGYFDSSGRFQPSEVAVGSSVTLATSAAADDIIDTATAHGYVAGDLVTFTALTGGTGLSAHRGYYVIAANLAATTFQVSATLGGSAVNFTTDVTAGSVRKGGEAQLVRAVKISAS